jgi:voltage-gated potassium channel
MAVTPSSEEPRQGGAVRLLAPVAALLALIGFGVIVAPEGPLFALTIVSMLGLTVLFFTGLFPRRWFFALSLANGLGIYACIFAFFVDANFSRVARPLLFLGFPLPILAFMHGAWRSRERIREIIATTQLPGARQLRRAFAWAGPVAIIGGLTFAVPSLGNVVALDTLFLLAMAAIAIVIWRASPPVSTFLMDTSLLFEEFLERVEKLTVAAFAFLTFYSLFVILFAGIYMGLDTLQPGVHFAMHGAPAEMRFSECLYFSIATLATVGYGDITPASDAARLLAALQVIIGVVLLLFGFSEIMAYTRERQRGSRD